MKNIVFIFMAALLSLNILAQDLEHAMKIPLVKKDIMIREGISPSISPVSIPDRTLLKPAPKELWKPLPQFQVDKNKKPGWYALENADNPLYWQGVNPGKIIICLKKGIPESSIRFFTDKYALKPTKEKSMFPEIMNFFVYQIPDPSKEKILEIISEAKSMDNIEFAEPDVILKSSTCSPNDPYFSSYQWGPYKVWADSAWCYTTGSNTWQMIGIIDNAVDYTHPDLYTNVWYGYDFADDDNNPIPVNTTVNHGTHVAGISSGKINNGTGIAGMANDTVFFAKVTSDADPIPYNYTACVNALNYFSTIPRIRVVNMSFGGPTINAALQTACDNAWNNGKLLIAAAGNDAQNGNPVNYPAAFNSVVAVGSVDVNNSWSTFSSHGNYVEVSAPGGDNSQGAGDIYSTLPNNSYGFMAGTSMASPLVTGLAGLMFAANPALTNSQARTILQQCVFDLGTSGWDQYYGYGEVCAFCAVISAIQLISVEEIYPGDFSCSIFPNPSDGQFTIQTGKDNSIASIHIINSLGKEIRPKNGDYLFGKNIDISNQADGIYFIIISAANGVSVQKIILNK